MTDALTTPTAPAPRPVGRRSGPGAPPPTEKCSHDVWVIARRGLVHMRRQPEQLSDATIQPIMFVVMFAYVFGGAIAIPGAAVLLSRPTGSS